MNRESKLALEAQLQDDALSSVSANVVSAGVDIVSIDRFGSFWARQNEVLARLVFTASESDYCSSKHSPAKHLAGTFAAKEAVFKALSMRWHDQFSWLMIAIDRDDSGCPSVNLSGTARLAAMEAGIERVAVSISYADDHAVAVAQGLVPA